jgi:hypothetical protein
MHKFGGRWTSTIYNHASDEAPQKRDDGHFELDMDQDGSFRRNKHFRADGQERDIVVTEHDDGLILVEENPDRTFFGAEFVNIGGLFKIILGDAVKPDDVKPRAKSVKRGKAATNLAGQEQGTWVGTQP